MAFSFAGLPGQVGTSVSVGSRGIFARDPDPRHCIPNFVIIDGGEAHDPTNSNPGTLQVGHVLAKHTGGAGDATADNKYKSAFVGSVTSAYSSGGTTLTVGTGAATEISRRYGTSGTAEFVVTRDLNVNTYETPDIDLVDVTFSAVDTSAGTLTITDLGVDIAAGNVLIAKEALLGAQTAEALQPLLLVCTPDEGICVVDGNGDGIDVQLNQVWVGGHLDVSKIQYYSDMPAGVKLWFKLELNDGREFTFSDEV